MNTDIYVLIALNVFFYRPGSIMVLFYYLKLEECMEEICPPLKLAH